MINHLETLIFGRVSRNIIFWLLLAFFEYFGSGGNILLFPIYFIVLTFSFAGSCYLNNLILIPKFLLRRKYWLFCGSFVLLLCFTTILSYYITYFSNKYFTDLNYMGSSNHIIPLPYHLFPSIIFLVVFASAKFTTDVFHNQRKLESLENERLLSELESLKSQINPHFLFNSLNTIYGLAKRSDSETADAILKLSDILRYILYECNDKLINIEKEITFLNNFIDFVKLRSSNSRINLVINAEIGNQQIAPLILLPFIENAIKHGLGKHILNSWIDINMKLTELQFIFECCNSNHNKNKFESKFDKSSGIGLKNVKRRLDLLYGKKHELIIENNEDVFLVKLTIDL